MISLLLLIVQLFTFGFSQPGSLISQVLQERSNIPQGQNFAANVVNQRPSIPPNAVITAPATIPQPQPLEPVPGATEFSPPGSLISQVVQARNDIPSGQNFAADIVNKRPSSAPSIVLPPPTEVPVPGSPVQGTPPGQLPGAAEFAPPGSLISQVLQARNDIPSGQNLAADIVNKRPSSAPSIVLPEVQGQGQGGAPGQTPQGPGQGGAPGQTPQGPSQGGAPGQTPQGPSQGGAPGQTPQGPGQGGAPGQIPQGPGQGGAPGQTPQGPGTPATQNPTASPVTIGRPVVPLPLRRTSTPDPKVVVVAPKQVVVKQTPRPIVSKKSAHGISLVVVPDDDKCIKLEDILKDTPQLSTLAKALDVAKLKKPNKKENTIFAPTNAAFEKLANQFGVTLEEILKDPNLDSILLYHFVPGKLLKAADLKNNQILETRLKDQKLQADKSEKNVVKIKAFASTAKVVKADVKSCDLIIHIIDTVLLPEV